jgi:hypothetical protein
MGQVIHNTYISKERTYLFLLYSGFIIAAIGGLIVAMGLNDGTMPVFGIILLVLGGIGLCASSIYFMVLFYQAWRFVIYELRRDNLSPPSIETPGKAIGYCFIPFYNFYWAFKAYGKLPVDINVLARGRGIPGTAPEGIGVAIPILSIIGVIPYIGYVTSAVEVLILIPIFICKSVSLCREISEKPQAQTQIDQVDQV